jgi:putative ABC transport system permease protein
VTGAVRLLSAAFLRRRARAVVGLVLAIGLGAGVSLTAAEGARRAATGWERFRAATLAPDATFGLPPNAPPGTLERVAELPSVDAVAPFFYTPVAPQGIVAGIDGGSFVGLTDAYGTSMYRPRILAGRRPRPGRSDEVTMNRPMADRAGLRVGQRVTLFSGFDPANLTNLGPVTVVGVHLGSFDVASNSGGASLLLPAAFFRAHRADLEVAQAGGAVRLRGGEAATPGFARQLAALAGSGTFVITAQEEGTAVSDALHVQALALWLLAAVAGLATLVAGIQALGRVLGAAAADDGVLAALGLTAPGRRALWWVPALVVGAGAAAVAGAGAVAASPLLPLGLARRVEPNPGVFVDPLTLAAGAAVVLVGLATAGLIQGWRHTRVGQRPARPRPPAPQAGPVTLGIGAGWALAPARGPAGAAARSAVAAAAAGIAGVVAVATFTASLHHLFATERLYGWDFDGALVMPGGTSDRLDQAVAALADDPAVTGLARGGLVSLAVGGQTVEAFAIDPVRGRAQPTLLAGRAPVGDDEVVLGTGTLERLGRTVGDAVPVDGAAPPRTLRVVGVAAFPELGIDGDLANGGLLTRAAADALGLKRSSGLALVRVTPGVAVGKVLSRQARGNLEAVLPFEPARLRNLREVGAIPAVLAGFLTLLAAAAVGHALAVSVRAHRREIGVLRVLGLVRGQVRRIVAAQAAVTVAVGLMVGVPLGLVAGRWSWTLIAGGLGVLVRPVMPWVAALATVAAAFVAANAVAALPARAAARLRPAEILRTE